MRLEVIFMDEFIFVLDLILILKVEEFIEDLKKDYIIVIVIYNM